jgi:UPF0288 family protein (methanogenesis marker protein 3)
MDDKDELEISLRGRGDLTVRLHGTDEGNTLADIALRRTADSWAISGSQSPKAD